ncbi:MAG: hypothetical protein V1723_00960 [Candidatus Uhrbacteria bacterium]
MERSQLPVSATVLATLLAWVLWFFIVLRTNPDAGGIGVLAQFLGTLAVAVAGTATLVGLAARRRLADHSRAIRISVRQGILFGLAVAIAVLLRSHNLLTWINLVALVAALTALEWFWISLYRDARREIAEEA